MTLLHDLLAFALPQCCAGCGVPTVGDPVLCARCIAEIPAVGSGLCVRCLLEEAEPSGCRRHSGRVVWPAWSYDEHAAEVVRSLKFGGRPGIAATLGAEIAQRLPAGYRPDLVLEVPLHVARRRERGFDQAALLADAVARALGAPHAAGALVRTRPTRAQSGLGARARRDNLSGADIQIDVAQDICFVSFHIQMQEVHPAQLMFLNQLLHRPARHRYLTDVIRRDGGKVADEMLTIR